MSQINRRNTWQGFFKRPSLLISKRYVRWMNAYLTVVLEPRCNSHSVTRGHRFHLWVAESLKRSSSYHSSSVHIYPFPSLDRFEAIPTSLWSCHFRSLKYNIDSFSCSSLLWMYKIKRAIRVDRILVFEDFKISRQMWIQIKNLYYIAHLCLKVLEQSKTSLIWNVFDLKDLFDLKKVWYRSIDDTPSQIIYILTIDSPLCCSTW